MPVYATKFDVRAICLRTWAWTITCCPLTIISYLHLISFANTNAMVHAETHPHDYSCVWLPLNLSRVSWKTQSKFTYSSDGQLCETRTPHFARKKCRGRHCYWIGTASIRHRFQHSVINYSWRTVLGQCDCHTLCALIMYSLMSTFYQ